MFSRAVVSKELDICLQCQSRLLRHPSRRSGLIPSGHRPYSATPRRLEFENDVRATGSRDRPEKSFRLSERRQNTGRTHSAVENNTLRLSTSIPELDDAPLRSHRSRGAREQDEDVSQIPAQDEHIKKLRVAGPQIGEASIRRKPYDGTPEATEQENKFPAFRHPDIASDRVELGLERLGEPAAIRVLPDRQDRPKKRPTRQARLHAKVIQKLEQPQPPMSSFDDIVKALDLENQGAAGAAESMNNIETLRKAFFSSINQFEGASQAECLQLATSLDNGFTIAQLRGYRTLASQMGPSETDRLDTVAIHERYKVSIWYTGPAKWPQAAIRRLDPKTIPHEKDYYAVLSNGKDAEGYPTSNAKQRAVNSILRRCWGIRPREERLQQGTVSLQIGRDWFDLLLHQNETIFYKVAELFKVKTEIADDQRLVRLTGPYDACLDAVRAITTTVSAARVQRVDLLEIKSSSKISKQQRSHMQDVVRQPQFWNQVESQTSTKIKPINVQSDGNYTSLDVFYFAENARGLVDVQRRIYQLQKLLMETTIPWTSFPKVPSRLSLVNLPASPDLPLTERNLQWVRARYATPFDLEFDEEFNRATHSEEVETTHIIGSGQSDEIYGNLTHLWSTMRHSIREALNVKPSEKGHWEPSPRTTVSASLGQLVHAITDEKLARLQQKIEKRKSANVTDSVKEQNNVLPHVFGYRRTMVGGIPFLTRALGRLINDEVTMSNYFKIVLVPSSVKSSGSEENLDYIPELELEVSIDEKNKTTTLQEVRLILNKRYADLALLEEPADVRFSSRTYMLGKKDDSDPEIVQFLQNSNLNVWGTGRFETPPTLTLELPRRVAQIMEQLSNPRKKGTASAIMAGNSRTTDESTSRAGTKSDAADKQSSSTSTESTKDMSSDLDDEGPHDAGNAVISSKADTVEVQYTFDSLSVHSKLHSMYSGFLLGFSTVEAGQIGGKGEELELEIRGIADTAFLVKDKKSKNAVSIAKPYFMAMFGSVIDLISRLPK